MPGTYLSLGTDGYGRSDTRKKLRRHFETDAPHVVVGALSALAETDDAKPQDIADAIARYERDPEAADPLTAEPRRTCPWVRRVCAPLRRGRAADAAQRHR